MLLLGRKVAGRVGISMHGYPTGRAVVRHAWVLMHRARYLARDVFPGDDDRLLVTTFTRNLALDLQSHLRTLCARDFDRIEVQNIHSWAIRFMRLAWRGTSRV